jgi:NADH:ubiquinone oxidoreductase subunit D
MMEKDGLKEKYIELNMGPQHPSTHGVLTETLKKYVNLISTVMPSYISTGWIM